MSDLEDKIIKLVFYNSLIGCNNFKPYNKVIYISCKGVQKFNSRIGWASTCKKWLHPFGQNSLIKLYCHDGIYHKNLVVIKLWLNIQTFLSQINYSSLRGGFRGARLVSYKSSLYQNEPFFIATVFLTCNWK